MKHYTNERNVQILIYLLKKHNLKKIIASPGTTNISFIGSIQNDPFFELYSCVDERSAAYMAIGLAKECGEPVALSCTGATASRNYISALTEAFYSDIPLLAITSTQHIDRIGQMVPQVIDRTNLLNDISRLSVQIQTINSDEDEWACGMKINNALLGLKKNGGGPVHINLTTVYSKDFSTKEIKPIRVINRYTLNDLFPIINYSKVCVFIGQHMPFSKELEKEIELFCEKYNGIVVSEPISNYKGKYNINATLLTNQMQYSSANSHVPLLIHIGNISGFTSNMNPTDVWRVHPDGEVRDMFKKLVGVFEVSELHFFKKYNSIKDDKCVSFYNSFKNEIMEMKDKIPSLPFSNPWIANEMNSKLPSNSIIYLGILNTLRAWSLIGFNCSNSVYSNTGGFGIDGLVSSIVGASLHDKNKIYIGIIGDLAFFYDMNALGNRHIGKNVRIMVINNGRGTEFRNFNHPANMFDNDADLYMAAAGHFGNKSKLIINNYVSELGFQYMSASNKKEFLENIELFLDTSNYSKPIVFEVFTDSIDESNALEILYNLVQNPKGVIKNKVKEVVGQETITAIKKMIKK